MSHAKPSENISDYLQTLQVERRLSDHTIKAYQRDLQKLLKFSDDNGLLLWNALTNHKARLFAAKLNAQGMHAKSIQRILSANRGLCNYLISRGLLSNNPFDDVRAPKSEKRLPKTLSVDQITSLVEIDTKDPLSYRESMVER